MGATKLAEGAWGVVTGADSGIGLEFSRELARRGCRLVMVSNRADTLEKAAAAVAADFHTRTLPLELDLCRRDAAAVLMDFLDSHAIQPEVMINNAGIFSFREVCATGSERVNAFIDLHVRAVTESSRLMARRMAARGSGYILNMSSMSCWTPMPGIALYAATKAYIRVFSRALAYEMKPAGVKVMVACPGGIATDLFGLPDRLKRLAVNIGALYTPQRFVRKAVDRLLKGRSQYINGMMNRIGIVTVGMAPAPLRMMVKTKLLDRGITR